ncbi:transposase [Dyadobacter sp. OTU695]|uniref:transposase n=1 Tax=Dyadobacter sp. OTU695 TaxID=3043860 RepID=UPI00313BEA65
MRCCTFSHNGREEREGCEKKWSFILPAWRSTIEPVFGSLVHHYGLSKINVRGKPAAHKVMLASAICFNLKKYLKTFNGRIVQSAIKEVSVHFYGTFLASLYHL